MARTVHASGTQTAVVGTEHVLEDETASEGKVFDAMIDLGNMASGDVVEIRVSEKLLTGGTLRRTYYQPFVDSQDDEGDLKSPIIYIPAMTLAKEWKLSLKQTFGTGRDFDWSIYSD